MNLNASPCSMNQKATINQSFLAHHSVSKKQTPSTILATLDATMLKPQKVSRAPINEEPK
ncbi:uncharacterized protein J4E79_006315 [Alternaria viburni]|uniref:uncharacterized protein n=1 Tax=Alternaria viburni TaxID=566460 RepID=UPI0020C3DEB3|nr:uncharacterized protein J4E79_006315 [Alternaria viburni]KAI4659779.1 hypothetical protein J4E79_006315 [Alternaria viburni]